MATSRKKRVTDDADFDKSSDPVTKKQTNNSEETVSLFTLAVVAIVILAIVGVVFGYMRDQLSEIKKDGQENNALNSQVEVLKKEIKDLTNKAQKMELENIINKEIVLDLFDKNRELPDEVNFEGWSVYKNEEARLELKIPADWEIASASKIMTKQAEDKEESENLDEAVIADEVVADQYMLIVQPRNVAELLKAVTIKDDYSEFWSLSLEEKEDLFKEIDLIDQQEISSGILLYYIDIDDQNNQIPTVLVLTADRILRATFNIFDRNVTNYVKYRMDFEALVTAIGFIETAEIAQ